MTPQERQLIDDLFSRLEKLEGTPRDTDAESAIMQGLRRAPNATYALVQMTLLQDDALKRAGSRIQELEAQLADEQPQQQPQNQGSFLDSLRGSFFGSGPAPSRGSVPNVSPSGPAAAGPIWNSTPQQPPYGDPRYANPGYGAPPPPQQGGGPSFLGTAAAAAAGVVGGSLLMNSIRGLGSSFGGSGLGGSGLGGQSLVNEGSRGPWDNGGSNNELSREAGINDIGNNNDDRRQSFADQNQFGQGDDDDNLASSDDGNHDDFGSDDLGSDDSNYA
ncbi:MAG: DUF2076 domain-containing protein [Xanthobacteraceae bacterium]|nr:DUF2076 domain-containing protein [Xanthobacteraceae bacterium]